MISKETLDAICNKFRECDLHYLLNFYCREFTEEEGKAMLSGRTCDVDYDLNNIVHPRIETMYAELLELREQKQDIRAVSCAITSLTPRSTKAPSPKYSWHLTLPGEAVIHSSKSHPNKSLTKLDAKQTAKMLGLDITEWNKY